MTTLADQPTARPASRAVDTGDMVVKTVGLVKVFKDFWLRNRVVAVGGVRPGGGGDYEGINFEIYRGEVFGLLGPNGSGKSTTIKMILGLLHPTAGKIAVLGKPPTDVAIKERIGYLPEESYLYRFLNARETLDYYGRLFHQDRRQRQKRIDMLLEMVGLDKAQRRPVGEYSKGMQRRIGIAQALINDPEFIILDEPTTGLDPIGTKQVKDLIVDLARPRSGKPGKTVLLCSHLLADVEDVCDRVAIMFGGKIQQYGTVRDLLVQDGRTTIQTPQLTPELIDKIEALLAQHGQHIEKVEQPRQKLEQLFLDIVNRALSEGATTSGAGMGGKTASFLTGDAEPEAGEAVIDRLVGKPEPQREPPRPAPPQPKAPEPDRAVVEGLAKPAAAPPKPRPTAPRREPEPPVDRSVIEGLTSGTPAKPAATPPPPAEPKAPEPAVPPAPAKPQATRPKPAAPPPPQAAPAKPPAASGEQPDRAFLEALMNAPRDLGEEDEGDPQQGQQGQAKK